MILPVSAIIPTCNRYDALKRTLESISQLQEQPYEIIVIDASNNDYTNDLCKTGIVGLNSQLLWYKANEKGAAAQRNQGTAAANTDYILYIDDDILLEEGCLQKMWDILQNIDHMGGVGALVTNQKYRVPGGLTKLMYKWMSGTKLDSYAGRCIGPAWNIWPDSDGNKTTPVDWLSTVCVLYRRELLPNPVFPKIFEGYSYMEDVYLSLTVAKMRKLCIATEAKIFHDSQPGDHKKSIYKLARMQLINRHYVMKYVLGKRSCNDYIKLFLLELFFTLSQLKNIRKAPAYLFGKLAGIFDIVTSKRSV